MLRRKLKMKKLFVVFAAIALIGAFAVPAIGADWNFYGSVRMTTFWDAYDAGDANFCDDCGCGAGSLPAALYTNSYYKGGQFTFYDDEDLTVDLQANSRIGAKVTSGDCAAVVELSVNDETGVGTRLMYGTWEFAEGCTLLIGQDYTPVYTNLSGQVHNSDDGLNPYGMAYDGRNPQIKLLMNGFELAFIEPKTSFAGSVASSASLLAKLVCEDPCWDCYELETDAKYPKIAARYTWKTDMFQIRPFAGWQTVSVEEHVGISNGSDDSDDEDIDSWVAGIDARFYFGPAYVSLSGYYAQNPGSYGILQATYSNPFLYLGDEPEILDNDCYGLAGDIGYKFNDRISVEAGIGYINSEVDDSGVKIEDDVLTYYINAPIRLADIFYFIPEIGYIDYGDVTYKVPCVSDCCPTTAFANCDDIDQGDLWYIGAKWQINF
jgi:hypothetical protein